MNASQYRNPYGSYAPDSPKASKGDPLAKLVAWYHGRSYKEQGILGGIAAFIVLVILWRTVEDHDTLFVLAEASHFVGLGVLLYKLNTKQSCTGLSLRTQELSALFLGIRLFCSFMMEYDIHTILDGLTLAATAWVIYTIRFTRVAASYQAEADSVPWWHVATPCAVLALVAHPGTRHFVLFRIAWALCVYLEAVSVYPQLAMMKPGRPVERFTAHYVFALGVSRFFNCAHWVLQLIDDKGYLLRALGTGLWPPAVLISELVQTAILARFCVAYVKAYTQGGGIVRLPV